MSKPFLENSDPVLSCEAAQEFERSALNSDTKVWNAMRMVGQKLGKGILGEYRFSRYTQNSLSILGLIGKGHNGGDALLGIEEMVRQKSVGSIYLVFATSRDNLKPNTFKALAQLQEQVPLDMLSIVYCEETETFERRPEWDTLLESGPFDVCIDGLIGMQFRPPMRSLSRKLIERVNALRNIRMRVAVDLPSGVGDQSDEVSFKADVTFATGILKMPLLDERKRHSIGSIRYLDIGLFPETSDSEKRVLRDSLLDSLRNRRPAHVDKRDYGHLFILAGSRGMPGALIMSVRSALKSGVGLVTVCAPESIVPAVSALIPEAMWIPWPETPSGGLAPDGLELVKSIQSKASALLIGPGMGGDVETAHMLVELLKQWPSALVVDADALQPNVLHWVQGVCVATPHLGEFKRIAELDEPIPDIDFELQKYAANNSIVVALKGPLTRIGDGNRLYLNTTGNSVLARGGSGDLLAGLTAGLLAQSPQDALGAVCKAVHWHGRAADLLASRWGQVAVCTTDLLDCFGEALCAGGNWS